MQSGKWSQQEGDGKKGVERKECKGRQKKMGDTGGL